MFPSVETAGVEPASLDVTNSQSLQLPCQMTASTLAYSGMQAEPLVWVQGRLHPLKLNNFTYLTQSRLQFAHKFFLNM